MATIIVVDDEAPIRRVIRRFLEAKNHSIAEAENGVHALEVCNSHDVDVAIVDMMMPQMDGLELIRRMRGKHRHVKVVAMSACKEMISHAERENEVAATLKKPFDLAALAAALQLALGE